MQTVTKVDAASLLLGFVRLRRAPQVGLALPRRIQHLFASGLIKPRHLEAFTIIAIEASVGVSELAERLGVKVATASALATELADCDLVLRTADPEDGRRTLLSVAPGLRREAEQLVSSRLLPLEHAIDRLGPGRSAQLLEALAVVADAISELEPSR
ncbi:MAG: MarR family transcriptional regulator [Actinobacteria bacterium]|nr:MarR family transcriptional regulator [Actinomycetota bacterium]